MGFSYSPAYMKGHDMNGCRYNPRSHDRKWAYNPNNPNNAPIRYMLAHSGGVEYAKSIEALDFSLADPFSVWSVHVDYNKHQVCVGLASPVSLCDSDAVYAVGANSDGQYHYVNGTVFLPGVIRNRLVDLSGCGEFATYNWRLPCVTAKPVVSADGPATLSEPA